MTNAISFFLACAAVLFVPGPTNTLLATSSAASGIRRSLPLPLAELGGYTTAIWTLALLVAPLVHASPIISIVLRLACGAYLVWSAVHLWREGSSALTSNKPVSFRRVFVTTLLNPKAVLFALVIIPYLGDRKFAAAAPYLAGHALMTLTASLCWIGFGAVIGAGAKTHVGAGVIRRTGASVLGLFGILLASSVLPIGHWRAGNAVASPAIAFAEFREPLRAGLI
jgi:threonine/homoserine/homoserine lactone efflux protein